MSRAAEGLLEDKVLNILEQLYPDMEIHEYLGLEHEIFNKIFSNNRAEVFVSKLDQHSHNLALSLLDLMTHVDTSKIERIENGKREEK